VAEEERERLGIPREMRDCIEATSACYTACAETLNYSSHEVGGIPDLRHLRLLIDCSEVCQTTQDGMLRASELGIMLAAVCVEACEKVAESCRQLDPSDEQLAMCAEVCDHTADCCRRLAV
jgi:hypothetical protein